jgi:hypothetical protein
MLAEVAAWVTGGVGADFGCLDELGAAPPLLRLFELAGAVATCGVEGVAPVAAPAAAAAAAAFCLDLAAAMVALVRAAAEVDRARPSVTGVAELLSLDLLVSLVAVAGVSMAAVFGSQSLLVVVCAVCE